jgi:hypothetical protein
MSSVLVNVADAVVQELEAADSDRFATGFDPAFGFDTHAKLEDLGIVHCDVVPASIRTVVSSRATKKYFCSIDIAIRKKFDSGDCHSETGKVHRWAIEDLVKLLEDIDTYLSERAHQSLANYTSAAWSESGIVWPWYPEHLTDLRQYTGVLRVIYAVTINLV